MADQYALWRSELKNPTPEDRRHDRSTVLAEISGCWRMEGARTKPSWPVGIWTETDPERNPTGATIVQIGTKVRNSVEHDAEIQDFLASGWLKCVAVTKAVYDEALTQGRWPDGKPSRHITDAEKADIIPATPAEEGGNQMVDDDGQPVDPDWMQIKTTISATLKQMTALGAIDSLDKANKVAGFVETLSAAGKEGEKRRKAEKLPFDTGAAAVQAKWVPVLVPASEAIERAKDAVEKFRKAEERRIAAENAKRQQEERERLAAIERERIQREAEEQQRLAASLNMEPESLPTEEEVEALAAQAAEERLAEQPTIEQPTTVRIGTEHGKAMSRKAAERVGVITNPADFLAALTGLGTLEQPIDEWPESDLKVWLLDKAKKLAKARQPMAGMKIEER